MTFAVFFFIRAGKPIPASAAPAACHLFYSLILALFKKNQCVTEVSGSCDMQQSGINK